MNTFKKFALVTVLSASAALPLAAHAASNDDAAKTKPMKTAMAPAAEKATETPEFAAIDKDHSGKISLKEYVAAEGKKETPTKAKETFASLDKNKDHKLEQSEFSPTAVQ